MAKSYYTIKSSAAALTDLFQRISPAIPGSPVVPIMEYAAIIPGTFDSPAPMVLAGSLESTLWLPAQEITFSGDAAEGGVALPAVTLLKVLRTLPDQPITLNIYPEKRIGKMKFSGGTSTFPIEPGADMPTPSVETFRLVSFDIAAYTLLQMLRAVSWAAGSDELRPNLTGVFFHTDAEEGHLRLVATNGHRLSMITAKQEYQRSIPGSFILPKVGVSIARSLMSNLSQDKPVRVATDGKNIIFKVEGEFALSVIGISARYPDYRAILPGEVSVTAKLNRRELHAATIRLQALANNETNFADLDAVVSKNSPEITHLLLSTDNVDVNEAAEEKVACEWSEQDGSAFEGISVNLKNFAELTSVLKDDEEIILGLINWRTAITVKSLVKLYAGGGANLYILVMPVLSHKRRDAEIAANEAAQALANEA